MSDQENSSKGMKIKRITWKRAFHLLKCAALRRYKIKMFIDHGLKAGIENASDKNKYLNNIEERIQYDKKPTAIKPVESLNKRMAIVNMNENFSLNSFELNSDNLAKSIVNGIIGEIKTRSNSVSSASSKILCNSPRDLSEENKSENLLESDWSMRENLKSSISKSDSAKSLSDSKIVDFQKSVSETPAIQIHEIDKTNIKTASSGINTNYKETQNKSKDESSKNELNIAANKKVLLNPIDKNFQKKNLSSSLRKPEINQKRVVPKLNTVINNTRNSKEIPNKNPLKPTEHIKLVSKLNKEKTSKIIRPNQTVRFEGQKNEVQPRIVEKNESILETKSYQESQNKNPENKDSIEDKDSINVYVPSSKTEYLKDSNPNKLFNQVEAFFNDKTKSQIQAYPDDIYHASSSTKDLDNNRKDKIMDSNNQEDLSNKKAEQNLNNISVKEPFLDTIVKKTDPEYIDNKLNNNNQELTLTSKFVSENDNVIESLTEDSDLNDFSLGEIKFEEQQFNHEHITPEKMKEFNFKSEYDFVIKEEAEEVSSVEDENLKPFTISVEVKSSSEINSSKPDLDHIEKRTNAQQTLNPIFDLKQEENSSLSKNIFDSTSEIQVPILSSKLNSNQENLDLSKQDGLRKVPDFFDLSQELAHITFNRNITVPNNQLIQNKPILDSTRFDALTILNPMNEIDSNQSNQFQKEHVFRNQNLSANNCPKIDIKEKLDIEYNTENLSPRDYFEKNADSLVDHKSKFQSSENKNQENHRLEHEINSDLDKSQDLEIVKSESSNETLVDYHNSQHEDNGEFKILNQIKTSTDLNKTFRAEDLELSKNSDTEEEDKSIIVNVSGDSFVDDEHRDFLAQEPTINRPKIIKTKKASSPLLFSVHADDPDYDSDRDINELNEMLNLEKTPILIDQETGEIDILSISSKRKLASNALNAKSEHHTEETQPNTDPLNETEHAESEPNASETTRSAEESQPAPPKEEKPKKSKKNKEEKPKMDPEFFYDYESLKFKPVISEESNLAPNMLKLFHSFGYDCKKRANLNILDAETLIFSAGNMVQILNIKTKKQIYLETISGGAVGAIAVHPSRKYFAVGEKGNVPNINIYEYPSLKLYRILRKGTVKGYAYLDFDPTGKLLASLGSAPDFMLTIWDWEQENVVLRTKAFSQDVYKVTFSKDLKGILTTAGTGHIKFWKMASTFTGFKLQGDLGKFGKTEISDIEGYAELPDGKVLSGTEWGNMLLWDGGLIQTEICRKKNKACHTGSIQQITLNEGDIYTIGDDGAIRVWDFETIDTAEPSEEGVKLEIEPLNELNVGKNVALRSMVKDFTEDSTTWYAQDSNGGIWSLDLSFSANSENPRQLFNYHSGVINGIECCPTSHLFATTADDGSVKIYNYLTFEILVQKKFARGGTSLKWLSTDVDPDGATLAVGFNDGVLRFLKICPKASQAGQFEIKVLEAFKPHTKAIKKIAIDSKSTIIATGSNDKTIFFFSNSKNARTPIGYVNLPSAVTYMTWTPLSFNANRLLVCMENGSVFEYDAPVPGKYDTTKSYLIDPYVNVKKFTFKSIKSRLRHEEELERKRIEEEERKKKEAEERKLRGIDDEEEEKKKKKKKEAEEKAENDDEEKKAKEEEPEEEEVKPKEEEWKPFIPETPSKICWAYYSSPETFWLSMDDYDAGYLYECKFLDDAQKSKMPVEKIDEPFKSMAVVRSDLTHTEDVPLTYMIQDKKKSFSIIGEKNGVIRLQPMTESKLIEESKHYWSTSFHDNEYGHITGLSLSYDEKFLFSVGADSNIFGILFNCSMDELEKAKSEKIKINHQTSVKEIADIDDPQAYSIEQAKLKSENDKMIAIAESKKLEMRQKITELRKMFKDLTVKNDQLVPRLRLSKSEFLLEESIKQQVLNQINEKISLTYRELAWNKEKCRISLEKLKSKFKDVIDCEHIVVFTFDGSLNVSTFRTVTLPKDMENYKNELEKQYLAKLLEKEKNKEIEQAGADAKASQNDSLQGQSAADQVKKLFGKLRGNTQARVERALKKMDEKKLKRLMRKKEWEELFNSRLPDGYENPDDLAQIKYAEDTIGDFKLKSSPHFVVPENQRMNVYKAVERLMQIKQFINKNQMIFNNKLITLRDKKKALVNEINADIDRLEQIQFMLGQPLTKIINRVSLRPEETPEKKYEYTREKLVEFKKEIESKAFQQKEEEGGGGGFGGFGGNKAAPKSASQHTENASSETVALRTQNNLEGVKPLWQNKDIMTRQMKQIVLVKEAKLNFEQKQLLKRVEEKIVLFDAELKVLRHDKARIAVYMKNADLRHVTIFEEFMLLREFEKTENELENKLDKKKEDHLDIVSKITELNQKIDAKRKDIEKLDGDQKQLLNTYAQMTHDETKYADFLTKVYKRKIKRKKKVEGAPEDEESEEESDDDDDDDEDLDDDDNDSENEAKEQLDLDICPSGLKQELYDQVCQLREKRLDLEELQSEEKKLLEQLKKDLDSLVKKGKLAENTLKQAQKELEDFQKEKQKKINDLDIVVTLRLSQLQFLENGRLPCDLSQSLAFDLKNLERLQSRITELHQEKAKEKELFRDFKKHHQELIRDKRKMDEYVGKLDELCNKMMTDKFGKLVDLEKLELIAVNQQIEELKQRLAENEFDHERVMQEWLAKINQGKDESIDLLKANTMRINEMVDKMSETKKLEAILDAKQSNLGEEMTGSTKKDLEERQRLHTLVQLQAQEVEALKAEIAILSRKGGHILPPTQPPNLAQITNA